MADDDRKSREKTPSSEFEPASMSAVKDLINLDRDEWESYRNDTLRYTLEMALIDNIPVRVARKHPFNSKASFHPRSHPPLTPPYPRLNEPLRANSGGRSPPTFEADPWRPDFEKRGWRGLKILGQGSFGLVQAWQYAPESSARAHKSEIGKICVVKNSTGYQDFTEEARILKHLQRTKATHLVRLVAEPLPAPNGELRHLYLEYCAGGDMGNEMMKRWHHEPRPKHLAEVDLWRTFYCLAQGAEAMGYGAEKEEGILDWDPVIHFDLKPGNVMIGSKDQLEHKNRPIYKIGDFGLSKLRSKVSKIEDAVNNRFYGTSGWYTPEQFTRRWDYWYKNTKAGVEETIAGNFGAHTNVWAIGAIMWCMALLARNLLPLFDGYESELDDCFEGHHTYGRSIESTGYSKSLKVLILRCLMEEPARRPTAPELVNIISTVLGDPNLPAGPDDPWNWGVDLGNADSKVVPGIPHPVTLMPKKQPAESKNTGSPVQGKKRKRAEAEVEASGKRKRSQSKTAVEKMTPSQQAEAFVWTPAWVEIYAQKYKERANLCNFEEGIAAVSSHPEDMARLAKGWELRDERAHQNLSVDRIKMAQEFRLTEPERAARAAEQRPGRRAVEIDEDYDDY